MRPENSVDGLFKSLIHDHSSVSSCTKLKKNSWGLASKNSSPTFDLPLKWSNPKEPDSSPSHGTLRPSEKFPRANENNRNTKTDSTTGLRRATEKRGHTAPHRAPNKPRTRRLEEAPQLQLHVAVVDLPAGRLEDHPPHARGIVAANPGSAEAGAGDSGASGAAAVAAGDPKNGFGMI